MKVSVSQKFVGALLLVSLSVGCSKLLDRVQTKDLQIIQTAQTTQTNEANGTNETDETNQTNPTTQTATIPALAPAIAGELGASIATREGMIARITYALGGTATTGPYPTRGDFSTAVGRFGSNLPICQNPRKCRDGGATALIAYAACADASASSTYLANMFGVTASRSGTGDVLTAAGPSLVSAGVRILDRCMGGIASMETYKSQVEAEFTKLAGKNSAIMGETVRISFNSVCTAAVTFCALYLGF